MKMFSKRLLTMLLAAAMVFSLSGMTAFAEEDGIEPLADDGSYDVKYAVALYGIEQDVDADGNLLGLTFGPATGASYRDTYKAHLTEEEYTAGEKGLCLHWMSWDEIIAQSKEDPEVFEECLKNGCTHSVELDLNDTLYNASYGQYTQEGDGTGMLYTSMKETYRYWNATNSNVGGWPASRMRATLNGADDYTDKSVAGSDVLSAQDSLISCFPAELQSAIRAKAVKSDTVYNSQTAANNVTTYDKLWLFSGKELYGDYGSNNDVIRYNEGSLYQRSTELGITTGNYRGLTNYYEYGNSTSNEPWWLRSQNDNSAMSVYYVTATGDWNFNVAASSGYGVAPGFCLAGPGDPGPEPEEHTVNYAVKIWGIGADTYLAEDEEENETTRTAGLTFGPALGADYTNNYEAHLDEDQCDPENGKYCIHWMSWDDIIEQSEKDPSVFKDCMEAGCTKAVELTANDNLFDMTTVDNAMAQGYNGDGVSTLAKLVQTNENYFWNENATDSSADDPANVYSRARIRTALIGDPSNMDAWLATGDKNNYYYSDTYPLLAEDTCLLSCFPEELQSAIVPRETVNAGSPTYGDSYGDKVTYDKLWLLSSTEVGVSSVDGYDDTGGTDYQIAKNNAGRVAYEYSGASEASSAPTAWWTRSRSSSPDGDDVYYVMTTGVVSSHQVDREFYGLSPCFSLAGPEEEEPEPEPEPGSADVKYAVSIWGIQQDSYLEEDGSEGTAGLTFGPATGADYRETYEAHLTKAEYDDGEGLCIHWMDWDEIIAQSEEDPTVFEDCLKNGCTHSIDLSLSSKLKGGSYAGDLTGDGVGVLYYTINEAYRTWNATESGSGGWPASRMRATLNGADESTDTAVAGSDVLAEGDSLLSCFPSDLQSGIVAKAVSSDTVYDSQTEANTETTYDKLWLFSGKETYGDSGYNNGLLRSNEGDLYQRSTERKITTSNYTGLISYWEESTYDTYDAYGSWWLRSLSTTDSTMADYVLTWGDWSSNAANVTTHGLSPGFCLAGPEVEEPEPEPDEYNVKYAVSIWGIGQDEDAYGHTLGLTFGPATGANYSGASATAGSVDYKAHLTQAEYESGENGLCLHWMTWDEIIEQSAEDPDAFTECLKNGCTHAVELDLNDTLLSTSYEGKMEDCDGAGLLRMSVDSSYRKWNNTASNSGGWPASRMRATLNGADGLTDEEVAGSDVLSETESLFSCFPSELQEAITAKAVHSDTVYNSQTAANNKTTYDKLWLFSGKEVYGDSGSNNHQIRTYEGDLYQRSQEFGITTSAHYATLGSYDENGLSNSNVSWWLRSMYYSGSAGIYAVTRLGDISYSDANYTNNDGYGIAPGFCLPGPAAEEVSVGEVTITATGLEDDNSKVYDGKEVTLTASAETTPDTAQVSYQWYKDGTALSGETDATLTLAGEVTDSGTYKCVVTATSGTESASEENEITILITEPASGDINVKYAVSIWGMKQDVDEDGNTLGLTFGPAGGDNYTNSYKAHMYESECDPENGSYCIHWMTWDEIIEQSAKDPTVFEECLENGCTKSVELDLNETLLADGYNITMNGDGAGMLLESINTSYRTWNISSFPYNNSGWPASRIRATLNGADGDTLTSVAGSDALDAGDCLLSCFPEELQENIVAKAVVSDTSYSTSAVNEKTTYDKLWLFSESEIFTTGTEVRSIEGARYQRSELLGITNASSGNTPLVNYNEGGTAQYWWLRTLYSDAALVAHINTSGSGNSRALNSTSDGIAPGFCLAGPEEEEPEPEPEPEPGYDVRYAVNIWGINQDVDADGNTLGLTFGPATGENYTNAYAIHLKEDEYDPDNGKFCIHWMTWDEIIAQSQIDPTVFKDCMECGCTKAVDLNLNETLLANSYADMKGDGAGVLYDSIKSSYRKWNSTASTSGGWPASRVRATLNGADELTDEEVAGDDVLSADDSLLACFPEALQKGIVAKAVKSDTVYNSESEDNLVTTYDKLWLFSGKEVSAEGSTYNNLIRDNEGELYQRPVYLGITTTSNFAYLVSYDEIDPTDYNTGARAWWLRSQYYQNARYADYIQTSGQWNGYTANETGYGLAPGFCLAGPETVPVETTTVDVTKAWENEAAYDKYMPASVEVSLLANGEPAVDADGNAVAPLTLSADNDWSDTFIDLPVTKNDEAIEYTVEETTAQALQYFDPVITGSAEEGFTITNNQKYFDLDEEIVPDENDRSGWEEKESVNAYNAIEIEMSTNLPYMEGETLAEGGYTIVFHDQLDSALILDETAADFKVAIGGTDVDSKYYTITLADGTSPLRLMPFAMTLAAPEISDDCAFHVEVDLSALYHDEVITDEDLTGETELMLYFFADLEGTDLNGSYTSTAWYEMYEDGNETPLYTSEQHVVTVTTYEIEVTKYDEQKLEGDDYAAAALAGATLGVYYDEACENPVQRNGEDYTAVSGEDGAAVFYGLAEGTYYIKEIEAPAGYLLSNTVLTADLTVLDEDTYKLTDTYANEEGYITIINKGETSKFYYGTIDAAIAEANPDTFDYGSDTVTAQFVLISGLIGLTEDFCSYTVTSADETTFVGSPADTYLYKTDTGEYRTAVNGSAKKYWRDNPTTIEVVYDHTWDNEDVTWEWAEDYSSATATRSCEYCDATETVTTTDISSVTTEPTTEADGETVYTAIATFDDGTQVTGTKTVVIPKLVAPTVSVTVTSDLTDNTKTYDGYAFTLTATATAEPESAEITSYQWYTVAEDGTETAIEGATFDLLSIDGNVSDSGTYRCVVTATNDGLEAMGSDDVTLTIEKAAQDISYAETSVTKTVGGEEFTNELTVTTLSTDADAAITYTSSNPEVATVGANGEVTILTVGETTITATAAGTANYEEATASYTLTISEADKAALQAEYDEDVLLDEDDYTPASWGPFEEALKAAEEVLKDENASQEEVDEALKDLQDAKAGLQEKVAPTVSVEITSTLTDNTKTYDGTGASLTAAATVEPDTAEVSYQWYKDGEAIEDATYSLFNIDGDVADSGTYTCVVTASNDGLTETGSGEITVTIEKADQEISFEESAIDKTVGDEPFTNALTETTVDPEATITYASSDETIATVDPATGEVTILAAGEVTITATVSATDNYNSAEASYTVTVTAAAVAPTMSDVTITSNLPDNTKTYDGTGASLTVTADVEPDTAEVSYQWYKDGEAIDGATYSLLNIDGNVSDSGTYKCVVTATNAGLTTTAESEITITIEKADQAISFAETAIDKTVGDEPFTNVLTETKVDTEGGATITYASSDESVATVDENGEVTILAAGEVTITATVSATDNYNSAEASYTITVAEAASTPEPAPTVDKDALEEAIEEAESLTPEDYTEDSWSDVDAALQAAQDVMDDPDATQEDVDEALATLEEAIENLQPAEEPEPEPTPEPEPEPKPEPEPEPIPEPEPTPTVDKEILESAINDAVALTESDYTPDTWAALEEALEAAQKVDADDTVTQADVNAATVELISAIANLQFAEEPPAEQPDKTDLLDEYTDAMKLDESDYTPESWEPFAQALTDAQNVLADPDATQDDVDAAEQALKAAMDNLVETGPVKNGLCRIEAGKLWGYYVDDVVDETYTGFASNENGDWWVVNGYVRFDVNSVEKDTLGKNGDKGVSDKGTWWYVIGNKVQHNFTGLANYKNRNGWWYIKDGRVDFSRNSVDKNKNGWYYVLSGKVRFDFTGLANYKNANGWWYIAGGKVDFTHNGVDKNKNGWYYVLNGKVRFDYTGVSNYSNKNGWWYIAGGKVDFSFTGRASNKNGTWNVVNGKVVF